MDSRNILLNLFSLIIGFGASLSLLRVMQKAGFDKLKFYLGAGWVVLLGCLIGARVGFVVSHAAYFKLHSSEITQLWNGGLSWAGAYAGGLLFALLIALIFRRDIPTMLDNLSVMTLPLGAAVWLGCWQAGIAYGKILEPGTWWGVLSRDEAGIILLRVPVQLAAAITLVILLAIIERLSSGIRKPGIKSSLVGFTFSVHMLAFSFMRIDPMQTWQGLRIETWAAVLFILVFTGVGIFQIAQNRKPVVHEPQIPSVEGRFNET
jgi:phosphatidylglycerol:prolipoprotein diacylglycerol transferase